MTPNEIMQKQQESDPATYLVDEEAGIQICDNNASFRERCAFCGQSDRAMIGPALFTVGSTWTYVCDDCAAHRSPRLLAEIQNMHQRYIEGREEWNPDNRRERARADTFLSDFLP